MASAYSRPSLLLSAPPNAATTESHAEVVCDDDTHKPQLWCGYGECCETDSLTYQSKDYDLGASISFLVAQPNFPVTVSMSTDYHYKYDWSFFTFLGFYGWWTCIASIQEGTSQTDLTTFYVDVLPASLGAMCFSPLIPPFGTGAPVAVWNGIGKANKVGSSNYFGTGIPDPARAPTTFLDLPAGDAVHFPICSRFTIQAIIANPAATSPKGFSVTNAVVFEVIP